MVQATIRRFGVGFFRTAIAWGVVLVAVDHARADGLPDISYASDRVLVCAHRANCGDAPENSLAAIQACIAAGVDMIEIDVNKTKDGKLVLLHDGTVNRTTNGKGKITDLTWAQLSKLRLYRGDGKTKTLTSETVPTLEGALALCKDKIYVNLDLKKHVHLVKDCNEAIRTTDTEAIIMYRSSNSDWLEYVAQQFPHMYLSPHVDHRRKSNRNLSGADLKFLEPYLKVTDIWGIDVKDGDNPVLSKKNAEALKELKLHVWAYTLFGKYSDKEALKSPAAVWGALIDRGVTVIMTDESKALMTYLKTIDRR